MAGNTVLVFDFDRTIIDGDSDDRVLTEMGLTRLFNKLRYNLPWNSLMVSTFNYFQYLPYFFFPFIINPSGLY
jgi:hypothetical protein